MAKKTSPSSPPYSWRTSAFYKRLVALSEEDNDDAVVLGLRTKVDHIAGQATVISRYVVAFLPQYTDHGERHLTNVLQFMEELAGEKSIAKLSALECALAIMAAMTHDLGMVLDKEEQLAVTDSVELPTTPEGKAWQTYRDGHGLWHAYQKLKLEERATVRGSQMFGQLKADYIRDSHAKEFGQQGYHRIERWLEKLATNKGTDFYRHAGFSFREGLAHLAMSHGQDIGWLPARLAAHGPYAEIRADKSKAFACGPDEINWPWLSWLLRLADVMDCDASRTPAVLFESIGITNDKSQIEWKKHLSIQDRPQFREAEDKATLLYLCPCCPDPFTEKAIRDILGWINDEIGKVRRERDANAKHFPDEKKLTLELPSRADVKISERKDDYRYLDLHFRLDRDAVMELLMGEALYGEPDLALRELVQNSLDALHLRDLRLKLQRELRKAGRVEELPVPVAALDAEVEPLQTTVTWDTPEEGRPWIEVADNGVGMTRDVIERFLTQIGKSYYKSPDFLRERELMQRHGLLCTTISQFGIGFLSSFMLAEDVEIETRAGWAGGAPESGWRVRIHGAHGLIALYPLRSGAFVTTGTRVRLTLKAGLELEPFNLGQLRKRLLHDFYQEGEYSLDDETKHPAENRLEPAWSVGRCIVWPLFPVQLRPPGEAVVRLDESFHTRELLSLDVAAIRAKADEWTFPPESVGEPRWEHWDWVDQSVPAEGIVGTGSRVRLTVPWHTPEPVSEQASNDVPSRMRRSELLSITEPQLPVKGRTLVLVNGVRVPRWQNPLARWLEQADGVGASLWLDLRGPATPRLTADRQAPTGRQDVESLARTVQLRFQALCGRSLAASHGWLRLAIAGLPPLEAAATPQAWSLAPRLPLLSDVPLRSVVGAAGLIQELARTRTNYRALGFSRDRDRNCGKGIGFELDMDESSARTLDRSRFRFRVRNRYLARGLALAGDHGLAWNLANALDRNSQRERDFAHFRNSKDRGSLVLKNWSAWAKSQFLPEGLQPSLEQAFAPWCLQGAHGPVSQLVLGGPMVLRRPSAPPPTWAEKLDLLVPLTGNPLGPLARHCPNWATERHLRPLFTLPFMLGEVPEEWRGKEEDIRRFLGVDSLLAYVPDTAHWDRAFAKLPREDFGDGPVPEFLPEEIWRASGVTALWDIEGNKVLWAEKFRTREEIRRSGKTLDEWAAKVRWRRSATMQNPP